MANNPTVMQQLMLLKDLYQRFGALHEVHVQNLRAWPWFIDPRFDPEKDVIKAEVDTEHNQITYTFFTEKKLKKDKDYDKRILAVLEWVKLMLGDTWKIQILYNSETIFKFEDCDVRPKPKSRSTKKPKRRRGKN